jgi:hypothetical protein
MCDNISITANKTKFYYIRFNNAFGEFYESNDYWWDGFDWAEAGAGIGGSWSPGMGAQP